MPNFHGRNCSLYVDDSAAASRAMSGDSNNFQLSWTRNNTETTTMGYDTVQRISGLRDATLTFAGLFNSTANAVDGVLSGLMGASAISRIKFYPTGSTLTGCPYYTGCFLISQYQMTGPVDGPVAINATFQIASGSLSASTI